MNFQYNLPVNLIFGRGKVSTVGTIAATYGKKALIVTGTGSTKRSGLLAKVQKHLEDAQISYAVYDKVTQNPLTTTAMDAASVAKQEDCDLVIGVGGGSIMDCAKATAFLSVNNGDINDYIFNRRTSEHALPIILIPTTCGTGSEGNGFAVLTNPDNGDKKSLRCNAIIAKASIIDSECMMTMPSHILASVGFDALCHCMEAYISNIAQPLTDIMCVYAMELIGKNLVSVFEGNNSANAWDALSLASTIGGMVINTAGVTLPHGMEHPASGLRDIVHGKGLAALTPVIMQESIHGCPEKFAVISRCLGGKDENDCVEMVNILLEKLHLQTTLGELGIKSEDADWMADNCMKISAAGIANHPVTFDQDQIKALYLKAL